MGRSSTTSQQARHMRMRVAKERHRAEDGAARAIQRRGRVALAKKDISAKKQQAHAQVALSK